MPDKHEAEAQAASLQLVADGWMKQAEDERRARNAMEDRCNSLRTRIAVLEGALGEIENDAANIVGADSPIWNHYDPVGDPSDEPAAIYAIQFKAHAALDETT